jgi:hydroxyethylthiazole kinase-like uncharacterized protein yjeF
VLRAHSVAAVRAAEERAVAADGDVLMARAARGLADAMHDVPAGAVVLALAGPGNNGGDALFAAAHLCERGRRVDVCLLDPDRVHRAGLDAALAAGAEVVDAPAGHRYVLDGLLGIGARGGLDGRAAHWAAWIEAERPRTYAVDVPSGVDVDTGETPGAHVRADVTVTFGTLKPALLVGPAADAAGDVRLVDIGLDPYLGAPVVEALEPSDGPLLGDALFRAPVTHKYTRGVVGVAAGSPAYAGAAHLAVAGAQSGPAGMVRFVGDPELAARVVDRAPEVVAGSGRVQAWVVGPGGDDLAAQRLAEALADEHEPALVVDADALAHLPEPVRRPALLTPHAGELAAMLGVERADVEARPLHHATTAAERWRATVLLKGRRTLVAHPGAPTRVNLSGTPWLGTAGSGDVLAGLAGSLLATGLAPRDAGSLAAFVHGAAGVRANPGGPVTASAVAAALPSVVADLLGGTLEEVQRW